MRASGSSARLPATAFWVAAATVAGPLVADLTIRDETLLWKWVYSELGLVESLTVLVAGLGLWCTASGIVPAAHHGSPALAAWMALFALGFLYIAGEEASWGQHWIGWTTPDWIAAVNMYDETNLHNISYAADRLPKAVLGTLIVVLGLAWPIKHWWAGAGSRWPLPGSLAHWLLPTPASFWPAAGLLLLWVVNRGRLLLGIKQSGSVGFAGQEHIELVMCLFLALYVFSIVQRLKRPAERSGQIVP